MSAGIPRVAITGIGVVSPFGVGRDASGGTSAAAAARHAQSPISTPRRTPCTVAAPVPARHDRRRGRDRCACRTVAERAVRRPDPRRYSKASLIAVIAASEAWTRRRVCALNEPGAGVLVGSGAGGIDVAERQYFEFFNDGWKRVTPYAIPVSIVGMISSEISIALELHGISHVVSTGCTSSTDAMSTPRR